MNPYDLIGKGYRLGADFSRHGVGDCLSLARAVLSSYGIATPEPKREWYRRLRQGDTTIFRDELKRWGQLTTAPRLGTVALCQAENGYGLAVWFEHGWLAYAGSVVQWSPCGALPVVELYCPLKPICATQSG